MQAARVWSSVWRNAITKAPSRNYGGGSKIRPATMNEMPVPEGDFFALHAKRQAVHHTVLALGLCMAGFGLFMYNATDIVKFHFSPPATYK